MQKLNAHRKLVLSALLALTAALPLACGSDDSNGIPNEEAGAGGKAGAGEAGKGGGSAGKSSAGAGKGGAAEGGAATAGGAGSGTGGSTGGGAPEAGAGEMGGEGGTTEAMGGAAGAEEMAGAGGAADDYEANLDTACTTEGSLNCSGDGAAADKQSCIDLWDGLATDFPPCVPVQKTLIACLAAKSAAGFECDEQSMSISFKADTCPDENAAYGDCYAAQPEP